MVHFNCLLKKRKGEHKEMETEFLKQNREEKTEYKR